MSETNNDVKNVNIFEYFWNNKGQILSSLKYYKLFCSNNYLRIILGSAWKKTGIMWGSIWGAFQGWGSFWGRDHFRGCTVPHSLFEFFFLGRRGGGG